MSLSDAGYSPAFYHRHCLLLLSNGNRGEIVSPQSKNLAPWTALEYLGTKSPQRFNANTRHPVRSNPAVAVQTSRSPPYLLTLRRRAADCPE